MTRTAVAAFVIATCVVVACALDDVAGPDTDAGALSFSVLGDSVVVLGDSAQLAIGETGAQDRGPSRVRWVSSDTAVASVDPRGVVRSTGVGAVTITGHVAAPEFAADVTTAWPMTVVYGGITVESPDSLTGLGEARALRAWGTDVRGVPDTAVAARYSTLDSGVVGVTQTGVVTARGDGVARVVAEYDGLRDTVAVRVRRVAKTVSFTVPTLVLSTLQRDSLVGVQVRDTRDSVITGPGVVWRSSDPTALSISDSGVVRALRAASGVISATVDTVTASLTVTVDQTVAQLSVADGDAQAQPVGGAVPIPPAVRVVDAGGYPIAGAAVVFSVTSGGGRLTDSVQTTNAQGIATLGGWVLGPAPGSNTVLASAGGKTALFTASAVTGPVSATTSLLSVTRDTVVAGGTATVTLRTRDGLGNPLTTGGLPVVFSAAGGTSAGEMSATTDNGDGSYSATFTGVTAGTATTIGATISGSPVTSSVPTVTVVPSAVSQLALLAGDGQQTTVGTPVPIAPTVVVRDAFGNSVPGVAVTFTVSAGGGSVTGGNQVSDAAGQATVGTWTVGTTPGENQLTAAAAGRSATFGATATIGQVSTATSLVTVGQGSIVAGTTTTLTLQARDQYGNGLSSGGLTVAFATSGGTSTGQIGPTADNGDGTYTATLTGVTAGTPTTIAATINASPVTTALPSVTVTPGAPARITAIAGDGQQEVVGMTLPVAPEVLVQDGMDNPVPGATVTFAVTQGGGSLTGAAQTTDAAGRAAVGSWSLGQTAGENRLAATTAGLARTFAATATSGQASTATSLLTADESNVVAGVSTVLTLRARDQFGNALPSGGLTVAFLTAGGTSAGQIGATTDNGDGTYTATFTGITAGTATTIVATINGETVTSPSPTVTVQPSTPARLSVVAGDGQVTTAGSAVAARPVVALFDTLDNPVPGVPVTFAVAAGGGTLTGGSQTTDAAGTARVGSWTLGTVAGENTLSVTAQALGAAITATGVPGPPSGATSQLLVSNDSLMAGTVATLTLQTRDQYGNALTTGGHTVLFTASGGSSTGQISSTADNGDGTYSATFSGVNAGTATTIGASVDGNTVTSAQPTVTVTPGPPASLSVVAGAGQQAAVGSALPVSPAVAVYDALDNPLQGIPVTFSVSAGGGSVTGGNQVTDGSGQASVSGWTLGTVTGQNSLSVTAQSLSTTLTATGLPGPASGATSQIVVSDDTVAAGSAVILTLRAKDQYGNDVTTGGRTVVFTAAGGSGTGTISGTADNGDGTYVASFTGDTAGSATTIGGTIDGTAVTTPLPSVAVIPGPPAVLERLAGDSQTVEVGTAVGTAPSVRVRDSRGNVIPDVTVVFATGAGSGSVAGGFQTSDATGRATVSSWTLGTVAGPQQLTASAGGASVVFAATGVPGPLSTAGSIVSVSADTVASGSVIILSLQTADEYGNPIPATGLSVDFDHSGGGSTGNISGAKDQGGGLYTSNFTGEVAGTATIITATIEGGGVTSPLPTVTVVAGPPVSMSRWAGHNQTTAVGTPVPIAPAVFLKDNKNNPVPGVTVIFSVDEGGGQLTDSVQVTGPDGVATVGAWAVGPVAGATNKLIVTGGGFSQDISANSIPGPASAATSYIVTEKDSVKVGDDIRITLYTRDAYGNDLQSGGYTVEFYLEGGTSVGFFDPTADKGDGRYEAKLHGVTAGTTAYVRATIDGELVTTPPPTTKVWQ